MRPRGLRLLGAVAGLLWGGLPARASEPRLRHMAPARLEEIRAAFQADVSAGGERLDSWFGTLAICAPRLWAQIRDTIDRYHMELIPARFAEGSGVVIRGAAGNRDLAEALAPRLGDGVVRSPTGPEYRRYWANFPFDEIDDPVFIVAAPGGELLVHLQADPRAGRYYVFLVEAFRP